MARIQTSLVRKGSQAEQGYRGLLSLWGRPWFERLWVRQEVALAKQVTFYCGMEKFGLEKLARACKIQLETAHNILSEKNKGVWSELARATALSCVQVARAHELFELVEVTAPKEVYERQDLLDILRYTFDLETTKSHDRVYAIYHLSSAAFHRKFWPDYKKSIETLWQELAAYLLMDHTNWNSFRRDQTVAPRSQDSDGESRNPACPAVILALSSTQENTDCRGLPSWVPQFDKLGYRSAHKLDHYVHYSHCFAAGGKGEFKPTVDLNGQATLSIEGIMLSKVASIGKDTQQPSLGATPCEFESDDYWDFVREKLVPWYVKCRNYRNSGGYSASYNFSNLLRQGIDSRWTEGSRLRVGRPNREKFYEQVLEANPRLPTEAAERMYTDLLPFMVRDAWLVDDRDHRRVLARLAIEEGRARVSWAGRKGWVPVSTVEGDSVVLIKGAPFPFVVRKGSAGGTHSVIGDAYFDNLQEDECWNERQSKEQVRMFHFR